MSRIISKKRALLGAVVTSLTLVAVAIAFYSTAGDGIGTGTTADGYPGTLLISGDAAEGLVPGGDVDVVGGSIANNEEGSAHFTEITGEVVAGEPDGVDGPVAGDCDDDYFAVENVVEEDEDNVIPASEQVSFTAIVTMDDDELNSQDDCKDVDLDIDWSSAE